MFPKVVQVVPMKNYSVYVYFEDGKRDNTTCLDIDPDTLYELPFVSEKTAYHYCLDLCFVQ